MGGFMGVAAKQDCVFDLYFGIDYHSHLGTRRGGMVVYDKEKGFDRSIHNIENAPFRLFRHIRKYMSENESRKKTFISSYSYIYILYICTHINDFKLKEKQYG